MTTNDNGQLKSLTSRRPASYNSEPNGLHAFVLFVVKFSANLLSESATMALPVPQVERPFFIGSAFFVMVFVAANLHASDDSSPGGDLWSLQPLQQVSPPAVTDSSWAISPVDLFVQSKFEQAAMRPSPPVDRITLLRRLTFDLIGLPPTPKEIADYLHDPSPAANSRLLDRLLASPHYGERWGRHWLDVARYADTKGYAFGEHVRFAYSYVYRDYVIRSFNQDLPYNRFIVEQLAADQLSMGTDKSQLAALGFLTLGRRFDGDLYDIVDDRIDVTCRGFMALTVTCARCHDHKYDPIPTEDYYSLYGIFASSYQPEILPLVQEPVQSAALEEFQTGFKKHREAYFDYLREKRADFMDQLRKGVGEYLAEVNDTEEEPEAHIYLSYAPGDLRPPIVYRWYVYLKQTAANGHPVFTAWHRLRELEDEHFVGQVPALLAELAQRPAGEVNPVILAALVENPPCSMQDVADRYGLVFRQQYELDKQRKTSPPQGNPAPVQPSPAEQEILAVLLDEQSPTFFPPEETPFLIDRRYMNENWKRRQDLQNFQVESPGAPPRAPVLTDVDKPLEPRVFTRGDPNQRGQKVPRQWLGLLAGETREPFQQGSGRLELARAIASDQNPLTTRVLVNRIWLHHFGKALVRGASDFGTRSDPPTHPLLLDYLAGRFVAEGWSIKRLHRQMVLTSTYQQSSILDVERQEQDPENRLVWRMNPKRLEWEVIRDALLFVGGGIADQIGGRPVQLLEQPFSRRRTIYGFIDRQKLPAVYRMFDLASPDQTTAQRHKTLVPQQALFLMNSDFVVEQAHALANRSEVVRQISAKDKVRKLYELVFSRQPEAIELAAAVESLGAHPGDNVALLDHLAQVLLMTNEFMYVE